MKSGPNKALSATVMFRKIGSWEPAKLKHSFKQSFSVGFLTSLLPWPVVIAREVPGILFGWLGFVLLFFFQA